MKKLIIACMILGANSSFATYGTPYIGGGLGLGGYKAQPGFIGNIFGGIGSTLDLNQKIYLGAELNSNIAHYSNYNTTYGLGLSVLPGLMLTKDTMVYGRVGLNSIYAPHKFYNSSDTIHLGTQFGLGIQTAINKNWAIRGEYINSDVRNTGQYMLGFLYKFS